MKFGQLRLAAATVLVSAVLTSGVTVLVASSAGASGAPSYTCSGGVIPPGNYGPTTITGFCQMVGTYSFKGGLTVASGGALDAADLSGAGAGCDVFVSVSGGIQVQPGAVLYFGNGPGTGCPNSNNVVNGGIAAVNGDTVVIHGTTINGGFSANGGGPGNCNPSPAAPFGSYTNIEDSTVNGRTSVSNLNTCWIGIIRNQLHGGLVVNNNESSDTDAIEINSNLIKGGLSCAGNFLNPAVTPDPNPLAPNGVPTNLSDNMLPPHPNSVTGAETGQCVGL